MKLLKSSIWSFFAVLIRGVSALTINKLFAVYYGPGGIALLAHFQNLVTIFSTIPNDGVNRGIIRYLSPNHISTEEKQKYFASGMFLNLILFISTLCVILFFDDYFLSKFKTGDWGWYMLFALAMLLLLIDYLLLAVILAFRNTVDYFITEFLGSLSFFVFLYIALSQYQLDIRYALTLYMLVLSSGVIFLLIIVLSKQRYRECLSFRFPEFRFLRHISAFLIMALTAVVLQKGMDFYIREFSMDTYGTLDTGIWQGVVKISDYYMMAFTSVMMIAFYPQITASLSSIRKLRSTIFEGIKLYVPIMFAGCLFVYFARELMLSILLDQEFVEGQKYIHWQLIGDFLKMMSMMLGLVLLAQSRIRWFVLGELLSAASYVFFIKLFESQQIEGILMAHVCRYIIYFSYLLVYYRRLLLTIR